jgi:membrane protein YdbS with pleckstrin-like domain
MRIRLTRHQNLTYLWALVVIAAIALGVFAVWAITHAILAWGIWCILSTIVVIGIMVELIAIKIVYVRPYAYAVPEERLRAIRGDGYKEDKS